MYQKSDEASARPATAKTVPDAASFDEGAPEDEPEDEPELLLPDDEEE